MNHNISRYAGMYVATYIQIDGAEPKAGRIVVQVHTYAAQGSACR